MTMHNEDTFGDDLPAWHERADRLKTILMVGKIVTSVGQHLCRIRNISTGGMLVECEARLKVDQPVQIELRNLNTVSARVRWLRDGRMGIQFDAPIEITDLLHQPAGSNFKPRAPRLGASSPVVLWHEGHNRRANLVDVSQTGCRLELNGPLALEAEVRISIPGLPARHAVLRWARIGVGGFSFNEPLAFADLMVWDGARD